MHDADGEPLCRRKKIHPAAQQGGFPTKMFPLFSLFTVYLTGGTSTSVGGGLYVPNLYEL
jgi:hypothetical protein